MISLLVELGLLCLTAAAPAPDVSGRVGPLPSKGLIAAEDGVTMRDGTIYPSKEAADAGEKKFREQQELARGAAEKMAHYEAVARVLQAEEDKKTDARLWGLGALGVLVAARVLWGLVGRRAGRAAPGAAGRSSTAGPDDQFGAVP